jgi:hypothetical protein
MPLGSTATLFIPPAFAGPGAIPLMGTFPIPASPAARVNEAAGAESRTMNARETLADILDMTRLCYGSERLHPQNFVRLFMCLRH